MDVDLLVKKNDIERALAALYKLGYGFGSETCREMATLDWFKTHCHHVPFLDNPQKIRKLEIHWTLISSHYLFTISPDELWERAKKVSMCGKEPWVLSAEDCILHLVLHACVHNMGVGIRTLCDIAAILNQSGHRINWEGLSMSASKCGAKNPLYITLRLSQDILGVRVPHTVLHDLQSAQFYENLLTTAKQCVLLHKTNEMNLNLATKFHPKNSMWGNISLALRSLFLPPEILANLYSLPATSRRVYFFYVIRLVSLIYHNGSFYMRVFLSLVSRKRRHALHNNLALWLMAGCRK